MKEKIIKETLFYNIVQYGSSFFGFIGATAMRSFLGPYLIGVWSLLRVFIEYALLGEIGVSTAATFKVPFSIGKGDERKAEDIANTAFSFICVTSVISGAIILASAFILRGKISNELFIGLIFISAYLFLERLYGFYLVMLRARGNFSTINKSVIFDSIVNLMLIFLLVKNFKLQGLYVTVTVMACLNIVFIHSLARYRIVFTRDFKDKVFPLIKFGLPLVLAGALGMVLRSIDRIMIGSMMGITFVGYYSLALMSKNYVSGLSNNFGIVTIPKILEAYGKEEKIEHIRKFVTVSTEVLSYLLPCLLGLIFLVIPVFVRVFLPKFTPGILAAQILLFEMFFSSFSPQSSQFITALEKQSVMIPINVVAILLNVLFNYMFIRMGFGIAGVALGTCIATVFSSLLMLIYAMKHFAGYRDILIFIARCLFPLLYMSIIVLLSGHFISFSNIYITLAAQLAILAVSSVPILILVDRKTHILRIVFGMLKVKMGR